TSVHAIGPVKAPVKMAPLGTPLAFPVTTNFEPTLENVPPAEMLPLVKAPVEKVTEPRECPLAAAIPLKLISSDCVEMMPAFEISIVPNRLVRLIPSAKAVRGKASASTIRINAAFICKSPVVKLTPTRKRCRPPQDCLPMQAWGTHLCLCSRYAPSLTSIR